MQLTLEEKAKQLGFSTVKTIEDVENLKLLFDENILTKKLKGEKIPEAWKERRVKLEILLNPDELSLNEIISLPVFGHPQATESPKYAHLIPIKVSSLEQIDRRLDLTRSCIDELQTKIGQAHYEARSKVAKIKKAAKKYLESYQRLEDETYLELLKNETMPELIRLQEQLSK